MDSCQTRAILHLMKNQGRVARAVLVVLFRTISEASPGSETATVRPTVSQADEPSALRSVKYEAEGRIG